MSSMTQRAAILTACFLCATLYLNVATKAETLPPREPLGSLTMTFDGWTGHRESDLAPDILAILGVDDYVLRTYRRSAGDLAGLYIGYYDSQRQGDTIHSPLNCLPGAGWQPLAQGHAMIVVRESLTSTSTKPIEVNRVLIGKGLERQLVLYWYQSHRRVIASEYWGKVYTVLDAVRYNRTDAALVRIVIPLRDSAATADAERTAESFVQSLFPRLDRHLPS